MQDVLGYSPLKAGSAWLPLCVGVAVSAGIASQLLPRIGTRPVIAAGAVVAAAGMYLLSRIPVDGSYAADPLPGMLIVSLGLGGVFVGITTAANAGVPADQAGLAAALLNTSQQLGGALGLAVLSAVATARTHAVAAAEPAAEAATSGFGRALLVGSVFLAAAGAVALRAPNTRGVERVHPA